MVNLSDLDRAKIEKELIREIAPKIEKNIEKRIEERMKYRISKAISRTLEEEFMPPEEMLKPEFVREIEEISREMREGKVKTYTLEELEAAWKKKHEV